MSIISPHTPIEEILHTVQGREGGTGQPLVWPMRVSGYCAHHNLIQSFTAQLNSAQLGSAQTRPACYIYLWFTSLSFFLSLSHTNTIFCMPLLSGSITANNGFSTFPPLKLEKLRRIFHTMFLYSVQCYWHKVFFLSLSTLYLISILVDMFKYLIFDYQTGKKHLRPFYIVWC